MSLIADILLVAASLGLAVYCIVLSRRLAKFTDLERGVGGAVAVLSAQVDDLTKVLHNARETAHSSAAALDERTARAEDVARRLELHIAALHDLPPQPTAPAQPQSPPDAQQKDAMHPPELQAETSAKEAQPQAAPASSDTQQYRDDPNDSQQTFAPALSFGARRGTQVPSPANIAPQAAAPSVFAHRRIQPGGLG